MYENEAIENDEEDGLLLVFIALAIAGFLGCYSYCICHGSRMQSAVPMGCDRLASLISLKALAFHFRMLLLATITARSLLM